MTTDATRQRAAQSAPPCLYMLADHLDATLAAGEDILAVSIDPDCKSRAQPTMKREELEKIRTLEMHIISRVLKAREHASELVKTETLFAPLTRLFVSGTAVVLDVVEECGDATAPDFETGDCLLHYQRSRGLLRAGNTGEAEKLFGPDETFQIAGRLRLGPLLDLTARFLDVLDTHYELYPSEGDADKAAA